MHRNSQKRIYRDDAVYFITTNTFSRYPFFQKPFLCDLFIEELKIAKATKQFELFAFCILHDHVHLMIRPTGRYTYSEAMFSIKKQFSHNANRIFGYNELFAIPKPIDGEGEQTFVRLRIHKQYVNELYSQFTQNHPRSPHPKFKWQSSFFDHIIQNQNDFKNHPKYTICNFEKHNDAGYPSDWKYTSLNFDEIIDRYA